MEWQFVIAIFLGFPTMVFGLGIYSERLIRRKNERWLLNTLRDEINELRKEVEELKGKMKNV